jgi:arylsulfatase A-like enzyme
VGVIDRTDRPNVLLLVLDTLRADAAEPYGAPAGSSPALADLARRGMAVPRVRSTASWTLPSHVAMFTGQLARSLGLGQAPEQTPHGAAPVVRAQRELLLAEVLRKCGYATRGVTTNLWAGQASGFDTGFEEFAELPTSRQTQLGGRFRHRVRWGLEGVRSRVDDGAAQAWRVMERWSTELDERPFFWFVNLVECHSPYLPPRPYDEASALTRLLAADEAYRYLTLEAILRACLGALAVPDPALRRMRHLYAGSLRYVDDWVTRVLTALSRTGVIDDTLVIVCADHGENFGEGGLMAHSLSVDDRLLHVPFIVAGPGVEAFDGMLSLAELPARVADAIGLEQHPWGSGLIAGLPVAQWDPFELTDERAAELTTEWRLDDAGAQRLRAPITCAVSGRFKLVRGKNETDEALYDLDADPLELAPLRDGGAIAARAGDALPALRAAVHSPAAQRTAEVALVPDEASAEEVADIERRMKLMGYM